MIGTGARAYLRSCSLLDCTHNRIIMTTDLNAFSSGQYQRIHYSGNTEKVLLYILIFRADITWDMYTVMLLIKQ